MSSRERERSANEIKTQIEVLRKRRDQLREQDNDAADQHECAILALKWVLGEEIEFEERYQ